MSSTEVDKPVVVVPIQTPFLPDRASRLPLNMVPQLNEVASFHMRSQAVGELFSKITKDNLLSVAKAQEIKVYPEFYKHWKSSDHLQIQCRLHDVGTKSFNLQFDIYDETNTILLCTNIRTVVVCDVNLKPHPIPKEILSLLQSAAFREDRYFIPQAFENKPENVYETSTVVRPSDLDLYYHVNQSNYLVFMLDAAVTAARNEAYKSLKQDVAFASVDQIILDYMRELCLDENVQIETWEDSDCPMKLCFQMNSGQKVAFKGSILLHEPLINLSEEIKQKFPRAEEF